MSERKPARVEAAAAAAAAAAAGHGSRPLLTDRSTASAVLAAGGGTAINRMLAEAGSCLGSSFAGADTEAIESELLHRPRGRTTQARQSADVCLSHYLFGAHTTLQKNRKKLKKTEHNNRTTFSEKYEGLRTNQQINVPTIRRLDP